MDQLTHDVRRTNWLDIITECQQRPAGVTAKQWLAENGIKEKAYYYWLPSGSRRTDKTSGSNRTSRISIC